MRVETITDLPNDTEILLCCTICGYTSYFDPRTPTHCDGCSRQLLEAKQCIGLGGKCPLCDRVSGVEYPLEVDKKWSSLLENK